jgi:hypothetical protein
MVNRTAPGKPDYALVMAELQGGNWAEPVTFGTHASDGMQWHLGWSDGDTILLWSSDIGNRAWVVKGHDVIEVPLTTSLNEKADWMKGP